MRFNKKKVLGWAVVLFAVYFLYSQPTKAAASVNGVFSTVVEGADRLSIFFSKVL